MSEEAVVVSSPGRDYSLVLPGTWAVIPLFSAEETKRQVTRLVRAQMGRADRLAQQRRELTKELLETARRAQDAGSTVMYLALEILTGVPFPGALLVGDVDWPDGTSLPIEDLDAALAAFTDGTVVQHRMGPVSRVIEIGEQQIGETTTPTLRAQFRVPYPDLGRLLQFTVSAPMMVDAEIWAELFDQMIDSLTWTPESATPERATTEEAPNGAV